MINDMLKTDRTGIIFPEQTTFATIDVQNMGDAKASNIMFADEYSMKLIVGTTFVANSTMYNDAAEVARKQLIHAVYEDIIGDLYDAANAYEAHDKTKIILRIIDKIKG